MTALAVALWEVLACVGYGAAILVVTGVAPRLSPAERVTFAFTLGLGVVGWLVFILGVTGLLQPMWLAGVLGMGAVASLLLKGIAITLLPLPLEGERAGVRGWGKRHQLGNFSSPRPQPSPPEEGGRGLIGSVFTALLLFGVALAAGFDLAEGVSPPADADTLAYHFASPKEWLAVGRLVFVPRAVDGAVPLLLQATNVPALGLGGERALTLWVMLSGWAAVALTYVVGRRFLPPAWAAAVALVFMTIPAMAFAAGSGQVEPRLALFATVALVALADARKSDHIGFAVIAGLAVGFYVGAKYLGLLFAVPVGLALVFQRRWLAHGVAFSAAVVAAGAQWYWWNWVNVGDPVFPMLFQHFGSSYWSPEQAAIFRDTYLRVESPLPRTLWQFLAYPVHATVGGLEAIEATRTGFGPFLLLLLPFSAFGLWQARRRIVSHPLAPMALAVLGFYALWFFVGPSQRLRHLLPLLPVALIAATLAARRWAGAAHILPLAATFAVTIPLQLGGQALFTLSYIRHVVSGETREAFHARAVTHSAVVPWINANLTPADRLLLLERQLVYLIEVPTFFALNATQVEVGTGEDDRDTALFLEQLRRRRITHILSVMDEGSRGGLPYLTHALIRAGCAKVRRVFEIETMQSRTLPGLSARKIRLMVVGVHFDACPAERTLR
ncbi:MAG: hypothetical protein H7840_11555 [Alphaproteobacteria bacterium]